jgi:hypothetical protein
MAEHRYFELIASQWSTSIVPDFAISGKSSQDGKRLELSDSDFAMKGGELGDLKYFGEGTGGMLRHAKFHAITRNGPCHRQGVRGTDTCSLGNEKSAVISASMNYG